MAQVQISAESLLRLVAAAHLYAKAHEQIGHNKLLDHALEEGEEVLSGAGIVGDIAWRLARGQASNG